MRPRELERVPIIPKHVWASYAPWQARLRAGRRSTRAVPRRQCTLLHVGRGAAHGASLVHRASISSRIASMSASSCWSSCARRPPAVSARRAPCRAQHRAMCCAARPAREARGGAAQARGGAAPRRAARAKRASCPPAAGARRALTGARRAAAAWAPTRRGRGGIELVQTSCPGCCRGCCCRASECSPRCGGRRRAARLPGSPTQIPRCPRRQRG